MLSAVVGVNWGDEGKGRMVDLFSEEYDIVVRYQGGNNAGHTVINEKGSFILNILPSGILRDCTINVLGGGMVIDLEHLHGEIKSLTDKGIKITPQNLKISKLATICLPYHKQLDILEEERLAGKSYGSTRRGIAPVYADKYMKKTIRMEDIFLDDDSLLEKITPLCEWKNLTIEKGYNAEPTSPTQILNWIKTYGKELESFVCDTSAFLDQEHRNNKKILFEAQLGALRDIDYGIYPFTSSSSTIAAYAPIGAGIPWLKLDNVIGIVKAYSTCVGAGPFAPEMFGEEGELLRKAGNEYGASTGRPRRVGGFDLVASRYGAKMQGADFLVLTKLDVLSYLDKIPVCIAYEIDKKQVTEFPSGKELERAKPVYEYLDGFKEDVSKCKSLKELPQKAYEYIKFIENAVGKPIKYVSVGPKRDEYFTID